MEQSQERAEEVDPAKYDFLSKIAAQNDIDLREYTEKVKGELQELEQLAINDIVDLNPEVATLYNELKQTDRILGNLEGMLGSFQNELQDISAQVDMIKERSAIISTTAANKKEFEKELHNYISLILIPPELVKALVTGNIDEEYMKKLQKLDAILTNFRNPEVPMSKAVNDQMPQVESLKVSIIGRIRNFLVALMEQLKKPKTNTCVIQKNVLLPYKGLCSFLKNHAQGIFIEVSHYYCELMSSLYLNSFKCYISDISKLYVERVTKYETLVVDESEYINAVINKKQSCFDIGARNKILQELDKEPIICHISQGNKLKHTLEEIFRSENKLLADATTIEYEFVPDFFCLQPNQCSFMFDTIFKRPAQYLLDSLQYSVNCTFDPLGLLLIFLINDGFRNDMARRNVHILDFYFDKVDFLLWPRILQIMDGHIAVLKQAATKGIKPAATTVTAITKRYVELASAIYRITKEKTQEMLAMRMGRMKNAMTELLRQMAEKMPSEKHRMVFLLNNLDYVCTELRALQIDRLDDLAAFSMEYEQWAPKFIKSLLWQEFKSLFDVVVKYAKETGNEGEMQLLGEEELKTVNKSYLESVGNDFALSWGKKLDSLRQSINVGISSKVGAKSLFGDLLKELMAKYSAFGEIVRIGHPDYFKELTAQHVLLDLKSLFNSLKHESSPQ